MLIRRSSLPLLLGLGVLVSPLGLSGQERLDEPGRFLEGEAGPHDVRVHYNVMVPMRDGVRLSTDIYRPDAPGRFPVVMIRDPYGNGDSRGAPEGGRSWASHGYVYLHQDTRGRFDSEGGWYPFVSEARDGHDTCLWAGTLPWSNGKVGMLGSSYMAYDQWLAASLGCPYLVTLLPTFSPLRMYADLNPGGAFEVTRIVWAAMMDGATLNRAPQDWNHVLRHLPLLTMDEVTGKRSRWWRDLVTHPSDGSYWEEQDMEAELPGIDLPVLSVGGWFDTFLRSSLAAFTGLREGLGRRHADDQRLVIGPWTHGGIDHREQGEMDFGPAAPLGRDTLEFRWMDAWLKGEENGAKEAAPLTLFVMGENVWRDEWEWPLKRTRFTRYYLHSKGSANTAAGDGTLSTEVPGRESPDRFVYDPRDPVPTLGGSLPGASPDMKPGVHDQSEIEARRDVLVYSTPPLDEPVEVTGPIEVVLYAATSARDTDWTAKLVDVHPDGRAFNLIDRVIRARYRESEQEASLLQPGEVYEYRIDLVGTSNVFMRGHQIRLEISSSNFPRFSRNLNTGGDLATDTSIVVAEQTVYHDRDHPSHIVLPIIPSARAEGRR